MVLRLWLGGSLSESLTDGVDAEEALAARSQGWDPSAASLLAQPPLGQAERVRQLFQVNDAGVSSHPASLPRYTRPSKALPALCD